MIQLTMIWAMNNWQVSILWLKMTAIYTSSLPSQYAMSKFFQSVEAWVTTETNEELIREFTKEKVEEALKQIPALNL